MTVRKMPGCRAAHRRNTCDADGFYYTSRDKSIAKTRLQVQLLNIALVKALRTLRTFAVAALD